MGKIIEQLYQPMTITGKFINPNYFQDNGDGTYSLTPLMIRNIARDAEDYFKQRIFLLDEEKLYHSENVQEVKDVWTEKETYKKLDVKYAEEMKEFSKRWKEYKAEHPDEFISKGKRVKLGGPGEARYFDSYTPFITPNLISTIQVYNAARQLYTLYKSGGSKYNLLPMEEPLYSKEQFADVHKGVKAKIYSELGIPKIPEVGKVEKVICKIDNKKCGEIITDDSELEGFYKGLINYITSSNAEEYIKSLR